MTKKPAKGVLTPVGVAEVFISHASIDVDAAGLFARHLRSCANDFLRCFVAGGEASEGIQPGQDWRNAIARAIGGCHAFVCLLTPEARRSAWVNYELGVADRRGVCIVVVKLDPSMAVERDHPVFDRQAADLVDGDIAAVFTAVLRACGRSVDPNKCMKKARDLLRALLRERTETEEVQTIEKAHLAHVKRSVGRYEADAKSELEQAQRKREFRYMNYLLEVVNGLQPGDSFLAICGDKRLSHNAFVYMMANVEAARRGVRVHRIYVEPTVGFSPDELKIINCHLQWSCEPDCKLKVSLVVGESAEEVRRRHVLPQGFGLVIPSGHPREVVIHYGLRDEQRRARLFREHLSRKVYREMHADIADRQLGVELESWLLAHSWDELGPHQWLEYPERHRSARELVEEIDWA